MTSASRPHCPASCISMAIRGQFTPVLAKHSKSLNLLDSISVGVDRMQRSFGPVQKQVVGNLGGVLLLAMAMAGGGGSPGNTCGGSSDSRRVVPPPLPQDPFHLLLPARRVASPSRDMGRLVTPLVHRPECQIRDRGSGRPGPLHPRADRARHRVGLSPAADRGPRPVGGSRSPVRRGRSSRPSDVGLEPRRCMTNGPAHRNVGRGTPYVRSLIEMSRRPVPVC